MTLDTENRQSLDRLVSSGAIQGYKVIKGDVRITFLDGSIVEFRATMTDYDDAGLVIEDVG